MARLKSAQFDERMTLVEHLDELRTRIIVSAVVLVAAVGFCFWQNHALLEIANEPLPRDLDPLTFSPTEPFFTTVKLSMLYPRALNIPATRASTPNLFSTRTDSVLVPCS